MSDRHIYIATVHWNSDTWVKIQIDNVRRFLGPDARIFSFLDGVTFQLHSLFDESFQDSGLSHPQKLDFLATKILDIGSAEDLLLFIDGDAFPIASLEPIINQLAQYPLIAVKRAENFGDQQPHPCFCLTTVGFWQSISGTWAPGTKWTRKDGSRGTDVGGVLYGLLSDAGITWKPLLRSNRANLHPLFFGVYADCIYHHGAGFRNKLCRRDAKLGMDTYSSLCIQLIERCQGKRYLRPFRVALRKHAYWYMSKRNERHHQKVTQQILKDVRFAETLGFLPNFSVKGRINGEPDSCLVK